MILNLDDEANILVWDPNDPYETCNFSSAMNIYDTVGSSHQIQVFFTKTANRTWSWHAMIDGSDVQGGTPGVLQQYGTGTINFDVNGELTTGMPVRSIQEPLPSSMASPQGQRPWILQDPVSTAPHLPCRASFRTDMLQE